MTSLFRSQILEYNGSTGAFIKALNNGASGLTVPNGLVFGPDGKLYVTDFAKDDVLEYNIVTGAYVTTFVPSGSGGLDFPVGLASLWPGWQPIRGQLF